MMFLNGRTMAVILVILVISQSSLVFEEKMLFCCRCLADLLAARLQKHAPEAFIHTDLNLQTLYWLSYAAPWVPYIYCWNVLFSFQLESDLIMSLHQSCTGVRGWENEIIRVFISRKRECNITGIMGLKHILSDIWAEVFFFQYNCIIVVKQVMC